MAVERVFVTGATGFIGASLLRAATAAGYGVDALTRSEASAAALRAQGVNAVIGDLADPRRCLASCRSSRRRHRPSRPTADIWRPRHQCAGEASTRTTVLPWTERCLRPWIRAKTQRIIYVAGTSYYGECGPTLCDEDAVPHPKGLGPYLAPAIEALPGYVARGLPIVAALPGWVYGPGSWFAQYILEPLKAGKPVYGLRGRSRFTSPVHVDDCARALVHLIKKGDGREPLFHRRRRTGDRRAPGRAGCRRPGGNRPRAQAALCAAQADFGPSRHRKYGLRKPSFEQ